MVQYWASSQHSGLKIDVMEARKRGKYKDLSDLDKETI